MSKFYNLEGQSIVIESALQDMQVAKEDWASIQQTISEKFEAAKQKAIELFRTMYEWFMDLYDRFMKFINTRFFDHMTIQIHEPQYDYKKYNISSFVSTTVSLFQKRLQLMNQLHGLMNSDNYDKIANVYDGIVDNSEQYAKLYEKFSPCTELGDIGKRKVIKMKGSDVKKMLDAYKHFLDDINKNKEFIYPQDAMKRVFLDRSKIVVVANAVSKAKNGDVASFDVIDELWSTETNSIHFIGKLFNVLNSIIRNLEFDIETYKKFDDSYYKFTDNL